MGAAATPQTAGRGRVRGPGHARHELGAIQEVRIEGAFPQLLEAPR
jgi:hypothetical protein